MHKKVLIVEPLDGIRNATETLLRQNGYEVISLADPEKGLEVVGFTRPNLLIVASDLVCQNGRRFYERIKDDANLASIPMLLMVDQNESGLPFPDEVLVAKPVDPREFMEKVAVFSGQLAMKQAPAATSANPLGKGGLDDEFLDAALGLDQLEVVESEVLDKTVHTKRSATASTSEKLVGLNHDASRGGDVTDTGRVESLIIQEDTTDIVHNKSAPKSAPALSASGKIDILADQYGISDPQEMDAAAPDRAHDYDWFISEMQADTQSPEKGKQALPPQAGSSDSSELSFTDPSAMVDPVPPPQQSAAAQPSKAGVSGAGVEKFIDEFKKEIEKLDVDQPESVVIKDESSGDSPAAPQRASWEDSVENMTGEKVSLFTRQLAYDLAEKIAIKIVAKIDADKLLNLIKHEIVARAEKHSGDKNN